MTKINKAMVTGILTAATFSIAGFSAFSSASAEEAIKVASTCAPVQSASVLAVDGDVFVAGAKGYEPVAANAALGAGDQLVVGPRSSARVALGASSDLALKENSELALVQAEDGLCARVTRSPAIEAQGFYGVFRLIRRPIILGTAAVGGAVAGIVALSDDDDDDAPASAQ